MRSVWTIASVSVLENFRKQVFQVVCILMLVVIAGSTTLSLLTEGVKIKILKDLCMSCILFGGAVLSVVLASTGIPQDVENRTIYPLIARPMQRWQYVVGKYLGALATVCAGIVVMGLAFAVLIASFEGRFDPFLATCVLFAGLESAVICAVATALSTRCTPALASALTFVVYVFGSIKIGYLGSSVANLHGAGKLAASTLYHILPNLECFNLKPALVHGDAVPALYLVEVAAYGVLYSAFALALGSFSFLRRAL